MKKYRGVFLKNEREIGLLREANRMVAMILDELGRQVRPGLPTMHFEEIVQNMCREFKVKPAFQGMYGFPYGLCCSVNEVIVHGFPSEDVILKEGDIVSFDVGTVYEGFYGDAARTFAVGDVSPEAARLLRKKVSPWLWPKRDPVMNSTTSLALCKNTPKVPGSMW